MWIRRIVARLAVVVALLAPLNACSVFLPDDVAEKAATVLDTAGAVLGLLDATAQDFIERETDISADELVTLADVVRDIHLARKELESARNDYREGQYVAAYRRVKNSLILMQTATDSLASVGADVKSVQRALDAVVKALP